MAVGRMYHLSWILAGVFFIGFPALGGALGSVPIFLAGVAGAVVAFVYAMYLSIHVIRNGDRSNGGITPTQEGEPPNWIPYFAVESLDRAMSAASEGGGATLGGPIPMPAGRIAILRDPQGAVFALWEGQLED